jgi:hypothetical protein
VIEGIEVLDAICAVQVNRSNRPLEDVSVRMEIID